MDATTLSSELMKDPHFLDLFQKALGDDKIPDEKDPQREVWLKKMQQKLAEERKKEVKKQLETPVTDEEGTWMWIVPETGFCIKCTSHNSSQKVFINICQHERVAEPIPLPESEQDDKDSIKFKIPLSLGQARRELDRAGRPCTAYDVIVNPNTLKRCNEDHEFRRFVAALCMTYIKQKNEPQLNADEFKNVNFKCKGIPDPQRIRLSTTTNANSENALNGEIKLPENAKGALAPMLVGGSECNIQNSSKKKTSLIQEVEPTDNDKTNVEKKQQSKEDGKVSFVVEGSLKVKPAGSYDWSNTNKAIRKAYFREDVPERLILTVRLTIIQSIKEVDIRIHPRQVHFFSCVDIYGDVNVKDDAQPFLSVLLPFPVSDEPQHARFVRKSGFLTLHLIVQLPTADTQTPASRDVQEDEAEELCKAEEESQRRIAEQRARLDRIKKEGDEVMKQRREWVEDMNAVATGQLPPALKKEMDDTPHEQLQVILMRVENKILKGDNFDELIKKLPNDVLQTLAKYIRGKLGLELLKKEECKNPYPSSLCCSSVIETTGKDNNNGSSTWENQLDDNTNNSIVNYNFAKKAEKMCGVEMNNRFLFALDH